MRQSRTRTPCLKPRERLRLPVHCHVGATTVAEFLDELPCRQGNCVIHTAQKDEIKRYLGKAAAREIESLAPPPTP